MRTPSWEASAGALAALLNSGAPLNKADVYTVTLGGGAVYRWSGFDGPLTFGGDTYALGPGIRRNRLTFVVGVEVSTLELTLTDNAATTINGQGLLAFIRARGLDKAGILLQRVFWGAASTGPVGALHWFEGRVAGVECDRNEARISVKSGIELLDAMVPRDVYQPGCLNTLYDPACGVTRSAFTVTGSATSATDARRITFSHALAQADGHFDLGAIKFTAGANNGISRTVKRHAAGAFTVLQPWPFPVAIGDAFSVYPGCNKSRTDANGCPKFYSTANVELRFRGHPFVPVPETVL